MATSRGDALKEKAKAEQTRYDNKGQQAGGGASDLDAGGGSAGHQHQEHHAFIAKFLEMQLDAIDHENRIAVLDSIFEGADEPTKTGYNRIKESLNPVSYQEHKGFLVGQATKVIGGDEGKVQAMAGLIKDLSEKSKKAQEEMAGQVMSRSKKKVNLKDGVTGIMHAKKAQFAATFGLDGDQLTGALKVAYGLKVLGDLFNGVTDVDKYLSFEGMQNIAVQYNMAFNTEFREQYLAKIKQYAGMNQQMG